MAVPKEKNSTEYFRGIIRNLKSENRFLKKEVARLNKRQYLFDRPESEPDLEPEADYKITPDNKRCPKCNSDQFEYIDLGIRSIERCFDCSYKTVQKL